MLRKLTLIALFIALLAACIPLTPANNSPSSATKPIATGKPLDPLVTASPTRASPIQITDGDLRGAHITVWHAWNGAAADLFESQINTFNQTNQWGIVVEPTALPDYSTLYTQVSEGRKTQGLPDALVTLPDQLLTWDDLLLDLNAYAADPIWGLNIPVADLPEAFWQNDQTTRRVSLPAARAARFLFYNVTWAQQLGFNAPPATADEFEQQACAANASFRRDADQQNDGYGGWIVDPAWDGTYAWMLAFGGGLKDDRFATPENEKALTFLKTLYDENCAWITQPDVLPFDAFAARKALFISGNLLEIQDGLRAMRLASNSDAWTVIPFPGLEGKQTVVAYGPSYALIKSDETRQLAAWLFIRWMLDKDNQFKWVQTTQLYPLRVSVLAAVNETRSASPQWLAAAALIPQAQPAPETANWHVAKQVLEDAMNGIFQHNVPVGVMPGVLQTMDATVTEITK
jgi:ABC-type glycerol-3-phosphate transport system substrate-binding protein